MKNATITEELMSADDTDGTREVLWHSLTCTKHSVVSRSSVSGLAQMTDKEMGNGIVCCYLQKNVTFLNA